MHSGNSPFDIAEEVRQKPTTRENAQARFQSLRNLVTMLRTECGQDEVDRILSPEECNGIVVAPLHLFLAQDWIATLLESGHFEQAGESIDVALLQLSELGRGSSIANVKRVAFSGLDGVRIAGYLFTPNEPTEHGFVWGHGGFASKEGFVDIADAISQAGVYALAMDFEGSGESEGYTRWIGRVKTFSCAIDYLEREFGLTRFGVGGHSGGGAYPAACAAIEDKRISLLILWDCIFDFYDTHIAQGAPDPGGNPACHLEQTYNEVRDRHVSQYRTPTEVAHFRNIGEYLDEIYEEVEKTIGQYRHPSRMLGKIQEERPLAVLHVIAEDMIRQVQLAPQDYTRDQLIDHGPSTGRALTRPVRFLASGLFNRPEGMWQRWHDELGEPKKTVVIPNMTHGFEHPHRVEAIRESLLAVDSWLQR